MMINEISETTSRLFTEYIDNVNKAIDSISSAILLECTEQNEVAEAMRYSLSAGGKRIRPVLVQAFCKLCGGNTANSVSAACAIEFIHTFSLIHDDLPCMDDDDFRRGKPSCHIAYGEVNALLAGDALENAAFEIICDDKLNSSEIKVKLIKTLSDATGVSGMIGGQAIDTAYENKFTDKELLLKMYKMKTGALLKAACVMGCICAEASETQLEAAAEFAENLGLAFQIIDDILDITGNSKELGKPVGSDAANGKITFAVLAGIDEAEKCALLYSEKALAALEVFDSDKSFITELTGYLLNRRN